METEIGKIVTINNEKVVVQMEAEKMKLLEIRMTKTKVFRWKINIEL